MLEGAEQAAVVKEPRRYQFLSRGGIGAQAAVPNLATAAAPGHRPNRAGRQPSRPRDCQSAAPPSPLVGVSIEMKRGHQQNDSLADGYASPGHRGRRVPAGCT